jgi:hypothetical protein
VLSYILCLQVEVKENVDTDDISKVSEKGSVYALMMYFNVTCFIFATSYLWYQ